MLFVHALYLHHRIYLLLSSSIVVVSNYVPYQVEGSVDLLPVLLLHRKNRVKRLISLLEILGNLSEGSYFILKLLRVNALQDGVNG